MPFMLHHLLVAFSAAEGTTPPDVFQLIITSVISTAVFTTVIGGIIQFLINRQNARITERKNAVDAESDLVARYKEAASEERTAKESAVKTIKELLSDSKEQITTLKATVDTLTNTIKILEGLAVTQEGVIAQLTEDRDRTQAALDRAQARINEQKEMLKQKQDEIQSLFEQSRSRVESAKAITETFDIV